MSTQSNKTQTQTQTQPKIETVEMDKKLQKRASKTMSWLLRHHLTTREDGYITMEELLKNLNSKNITVSEDEVKYIVKVCPKQRFKIVEIDGTLWIRANQGHSTDSTKSEKLLTPVTDKFMEGKECIHGTSWKALQGIIEDGGISRRSRQHVHFAVGLPGDSGVISGMRQSCRVAIYVDVKKAMQNGVKFYVSDNGVLLSEGNVDGKVPIEFFTKVFDLKKKKIVEAFRRDSVPKPKPEHAPKASQ